MADNTEQLEQKLSEQQHIESQLRAALELANNILETIREPLLILDPQLRVLRGNRSFYKTFQVEPAQTEGVFVYDMGNGQWNIPQLQALLEDILPHNSRLDDFEVEHEFPEIGRKVMLLNASRVEQQHPTDEVILLAIEDITQRKQVEAAITVYIKKLEWSNRELQDFAYVASHDLQEPLRAIQAFGERLRTKSSDVLSDEAGDYLARMLQAAGRMRVLIQDLLAFSRITTKAKPFTNVDLMQVARIVVADLNSRAEEAGGRISVDGLPTIEADATQMHQLLQNLIGNALKFHRDEVPPEVEVQCLEMSQNGNYVKLSVQDNGIGFDEKYLDRIFTPFQRLHSQRKYEGTGIGLAICRKIVERHNGTITARSTPGEGTTFIITLPLTQITEEIPL